MASSLCPQVSVIPSADPSKDAFIFTKLFVGFELSLVETPNSVTLVASHNKTIVIFCKVEEFGSLPAVLLVDDSPLSQLDNIQDLPGVEILASDDFSAREKLFLRFDGGGTLLVASRQVEPSRLANWLANGPTEGILNEQTIAITSKALKELAFERIQSPEVGQPVMPVQETTRKRAPTNSNGGSIMEEQSPQKLPKFPTLQVTLNDTKFPLNAPVPVPFENELFQGKVLLLLRPIDPPKDDPYWNDRVWAKRKRRLILQIQGKFKRQPRGVLYAGAEVSEPMKLGLLAKGVCNLLLKFLTSFANELHYSFGDADENGHISAPAWNMFQSILVTKPGEMLPTLGDDIEESKESMTARASSNGIGQWNTIDTFTMSYHSMYVDLPTWQVVKLPFAPALDLRTFWGKSLLNVCIYDTAQRRDRRHLRQDNSYFMAIRLKFLGLDAGTKADEDESLPWTFTTRSISESNLDKLDVVDNIENDPAEPIVEELDDEECYFFDAEEPDVNVDLQSPGRVKHAEAQNLLDDIDASCPLWIDICSRGKYVKTYAVNVNDQRTVFRSASTVVDCFEVGQAQESAEKLWSPRLSSCERTRRIVGQVISTAMNNPIQAQRLRTLIMTETVFDSSFLKGTPPTLSAKKARMVQKAAFVARAFSDHHWIEEWMKATDLQLAFYHPEKIQKANLYLSLQNILSVRKLDSREAPLLPSFSFMEVQTVGQTIYLMFATEELRDSWVAYLSTVIKKEQLLVCASDNSGASDHLIAVDNPAKEFLHKSSMWNCKQRRILNCRRFFFRSSRKVDPIQQVEDCLLKAMDPKDESEERNLCAFLDSVATLKEVDVSTLSDVERTAFFLNLYHVMILHAFLVLGPPDSTFKWITYFNAIAYQCSDDIFSLTELEHNIIRAAMSYPSQFVSRFVLPKSQFTFALTKADYRINFALNCGSLSNPPFVPVYKPDTLDQQLDSTCKDYLKIVEVVPQRRNSLIVSLPRICMWFAEDFGDGSNNAVLKCVERYLETNKRQMLAACWDEKNARYCDITLRHLPYSFECRNLVLINNAPVAADVHVIMD